MKLSERNAGWVIFAVSLALSVAYLSLRQGAIFGGGFFFRDFAFYIYVAEALRHGEQLTRDIVWQYGPLPIVPYARLTTFTGNSPMTYVAMEGGITLLNIHLIFLLLKRHLPLKIVLYLMFFVIVPYMVRSMAGIWVFLPLQTTLLLVFTLNWTPVKGRSLGRALIFGGLLGMMQQVKFGVAYVAGMSLILVDLIEIHRVGWSRQLVLQWIRNNLWVMLAFLVMEVFRAALVWRVATPAQAMDVIWPSYMLDHYQIDHPGGERYPSFETWGIFLGTQLPGIIWLGLGVYGIWIQLRRPADGLASPGFPVALNILVVFYLVGLPVLFKHSWLIYMHVGLLAVPACWVLAQIGWVARWGCILLLFPATLFLPFKILMQDASTEPVVMPNKQTLWLTSEEKNRVTRLFTVLESIPDHQVVADTRDPIMVFNGQGSGIHFYGGYPRAVRHAWFLPKFVRPYEEAEVFGAVSKIKAIVVFTTAKSVSGMTADPMTWKPEEWSPFDRSRDALLVQQLKPPIKVDSRWVVFPIRRGEKAGGK